MRTLALFLLIFFCAAVVPATLDRYPLVWFSVDVIETDGTCLKDYDANRELLTKRLYGCTGTTEIRPRRHGNAVSVTPTTHSKEQL